MAKHKYQKSEPVSSPVPAIAYRVVRHGCFHEGKFYDIGDILPPMPVACLNVHLPNVEMVEAPTVTPEPEPEPIPEPEPMPEPEIAMESDYDVLL